MEIYKNYVIGDTQITHKISKIGLNLPTYETLKSSEEIQKILKEL